VLDATVRSVLAGTEGGLKVVHTQCTHRLAGNREHFGFRDGIAQPSILGGPAQRSGQGVAGPAGSWLGLPAGEFVFGYPAADGKLPSGPPPPLDRNGTFLVYRKLEQDVAAFRRFVAHQGRGFPGGERLLAAKLIGRWPDGTPLALSPDREDPAIAADPRRCNDFQFASDPMGIDCPIGSHVRRANPRDGLPFHGALVNRHRLIRRGAPYGPPLPDGSLDADHAERGLLFYAFNASFARQFEFIQRQWLNDGNALGLAADPDPVAGSKPSTPSAEPLKMTIPGSPPHFVAPLRQLVTTRGGEYVWMPGLAALRAIGSSRHNGEAPPRPPPSGP
jgi:Dyp-type peroxidase family